MEERLFLSIFFEKPLVGEDFFSHTDFHNPYEERSFLAINFGKPFVREDFFFRQTMNSDSKHYCAYNLQLETDKPPEEIDN